MKSLKHLKRALTLLRQAKTELGLAVNCRDGLEHDATHYLYEVSELISCDNGEAGLQALVDKFN